MCEICQKALQGRDPSIINIPIELKYSDFVVSEISVNIELSCDAPYVDDTPPREPCILIYPTINDNLIHDVDVFTKIPIKCCPFCGEDLYSSYALALKIYNGSRYSGIKTNDF